MAFNNYVRDGVAASYIVTAEEIQILWNNECRIYKLYETTAEEIQHRRLMKEPTFVVMAEKKLYMSAVNMDFPRLVKNLEEKEHLCPSCRYCGASVHGCIKVRDCSEELYIREGYIFSEAIKLSKRIEKYPFIKFGYEVFGIVKENEVFSVDECDNFKPFEKRKRTSEEELVKRIEDIKYLIFE